MHTGTARLILSSAAGAALWAAALSAGATSVVVTPANLDPKSTQAKAGAGAVLVDTGNLTLTNGTFRARAFGDDSTGIARVSTALRFNGADPATQASVVIAKSFLTGSLLVNGPDAPAVAVRFVFDFDGFFTSALGANQVFIGTLAAGQTNGLSSTEYESSISFLQSPALATIDVKTTATRTTRDFGTGVSSTVNAAAATPTVVSQSSSPTPGSLQGHLEVDMLLAPNRIASASFGLTAQTSLAFAAIGGFEAGSGGVEGFDTGRVSVFLPQGYALAPLPFLSGVPVQVLPAVPEPSENALLAAGLGCVLVWRRRAQAS